MENKFLAYLLPLIGFPVLLYAIWINILQVDVWQRNVMFWFILITGSATWATNFYFSFHKKRDAKIKDELNNEQLRIDIYREKMLLKEEQQSAWFREDRNKKLEQ